MIRLCNFALWAGLSRTGLQLALQDDYYDGHPLLLLMGLEDTPFTKVGAV